MGTKVPSATPTSIPTFTPTTGMPTSNPTSMPTTPTKTPTPLPTKTPTFKPTLQSVFGVQTLDADGPGFQTQMGIFDYKGKWHPHKDPRPSVQDLQTTEAKEAKAASTAGDAANSSGTSSSSGDRNLAVVYVLVGAVACLTGIAFVRMRKENQATGEFASPSK